MAMFYANKVDAAKHVLRYNYSHDITDMQTAEYSLARSLDFYVKRWPLTASTNYHFANGMQTSQRKRFLSPGGLKGKPGQLSLVPAGAAFTPKSLKDFQAKVVTLQMGTNSPVVDDSKITALPSAAFQLLSTNAETYSVKVGEHPFTDRSYRIERVAPELTGLTGIAVSHAAAKSVRLGTIEIQVSEPVQVLVGYFKSDEKRLASGAPIGIRSPSR